jgi:hypothetical protein
MELLSVQINVAWDMTTFGLVEITNNSMQSAASIFGFVVEYPADGVTNFTTNFPFQIANISLLILRQKTLEL